MLKAYSILFVCMSSLLLLGHKAFVGLSPSVTLPEVRIEPGSNGGPIYVLINQTADSYTFEAVAGYFPLFRVQVKRKAGWTDVEYLFCLSSIRTARKEIGPGMRFQIVGITHPGVQRIGLSLVSSEGDSLEIWSDP